MHSRVNALFLNIENVGVTEGALTYLQGGTGVVFFVDSSYTATNSKFFITNVSKDQLYVSLVKIEFYFSVICENKVSENHVCRNNSYSVPAGMLTLYVTIFFKLYRKYFFFQNFISFSTNAF